ncbi:uncharacterized protein LOC112590721 [Harpegnathos saltator]|uniref:uncharacterized protein LOC112590721 n=1 Tax=Harpegnathos saltator TaxID=610380 RepID=UPI000DBEE79A|nr:uncharacterized protein LOC112590721 [Harpegnathos saltator]
MANQSDLAEESREDRSTGWTDDGAAETGRRSADESKIFTAVNPAAGREEATARGEKRILKETSAPGCSSERANKSARGEKQAADSTTTMSSAEGKPGKPARPRHRPFCELLGKREQRREQLGKLEGELRQRLDVLECSIPAVMACNVWRMTQGAPACAARRLLEQCFTAASELPSACSSPSRHYDCRVREVEAERKLALKKAEEARALWTEKAQALEEREREVEKARRIQAAQEDAMGRLNEELEALRAAVEKEEAEDGECAGDERCGRRWLGRVASVASVESGDLRCLEKLQYLAEEELLVKRDIAELERREDTYMRTLQRADELWSKVEGDEASVLQEQLDTKTAANQQLATRVCELEDALEKCRTRMAACRGELEKFLSIEKLEAAIGRDDDVARVTDMEVAVRPRVAHRPVGRLDDVATVEDGEVFAAVPVVDEEVSAVTVAVDAAVDAQAIPRGDDKYVSVKPESADLAVERQVDLAPVEPEDVDSEQREYREMEEYLAQLGSLEELYEDDGEACPPEVVCNGVVTSPTGMMDDEELLAMGLEPAEARRKWEETAEILSPRVEAAGRTQERAAADGPIAMPEVGRLDADQDVVIKRTEVLAWVDKIDMIRAKIAVRAR